MKILYTNSEKFKFLPFLRIFSRSQFNLHPKFHRSWISLRFEIKRFSKFTFKILEYCSISHGERSFEFVPFRHHERVIKIFDDTSKERKKIFSKIFFEIPRPSLVNERKRSRSLCRRSYAAREDENEWWRGLGAKDGWESGGARGEWGVERDARHVRSRSAGRSFPHYVCALRREESREMPCDIIFYRLPSSLPLLRSAPVPYSRLCLSALFSCPISRSYGKRVHGIERRSAFQFWMTDRCSAVISKISRAIVTLHEQNEGLIFEGERVYSFLVGIICKIVKALNKMEDWFSNQMVI